MNEATLTQEERDQAEGMASEARWDGILAQRASGEAEAQRQGMTSEAEAERTFMLEREMAKLQADIEWARARESRSLLFVLTNRIMPMLYLMMLATMIYWALFKVLVDWKLN